VQIATLDCKISNSTTVNYICEIVYGNVHRLHLLPTFEILIY
jgi:hypothetical protein